MVGVRTAILHSYDLPKHFYAEVSGRSAVKLAGMIGCLLWYSLDRTRTGRTRRTPMDVDKLVKKWHEVLLGLAIAHDKDAADKYESMIDELLTPILSAPIRDIRAFYPKLMTSLKNDPKVPFLVWRGYEVWVEGYIAKAQDEEIVELRTHLAKQIADLVDQDVKDQIPEALIAALQWRSTEQLMEVKDVVEREKAAGRKTRLKGRESCLFLHAGGTEENPEVTIQI
jgi:hypothetical protein